MYSNSSGGAVTSCRSFRGKSWKSPDRTKNERVSSSKIQSIPDIYLFLSLFFYYFPHIYLFYIIVKGIEECD